MATFIWVLVAVVQIATRGGAWQLPALGAGHRAQYLLLENGGGYKYGYDTGADGSFAKQSGDAANQVEGHYSYDAPGGVKVDLKYTSGVQGFVPEGLEGVLKAAAGAHGPSPSGPAAAPISAYSAPASFGGGGEEGGSDDDQADTGDGSYSFGYKTDSASRQETSDAKGNVQGQYSYTDAFGTHDLSYVAGSKTGFVATSGSLATPNGAPGAASGHPSAYSAPSSYSGPSSYSAPLAGGSSLSDAGSSDGSYSFSYNTGDSSRQETSDASGNVQGKYSFKNAAGSHDLSYIAGSSTGFVATSGSLSQPNGLAGSPSPGVATGYSAPNSVPGYAYPSPSARFGSGDASSAKSSASGDGSYSFSYDAGDSSRHETSDASGNVQGKYSYKNAAGSHDLSYVAGSATGFVATSGSLSHPNGLGGAAASSSAGGGHLTGGYAPSAYSSKNDADDGSSVEGGSENDQAGTGDASYSFAIDTDEYKRTEVSDEKGNVKGSFSFKNKQGDHGLSFVAGAETGFVATGGSLAVAPGASESQLKAGAKSAPSAPSSYGVPAVLAKSGSYASDEGVGGGAGDDEAGTGDASYSFKIDTDTYKRVEASDANGNVKGSYSFTSAVGDHNLNYVAGSKTGFLATGGNLAVAPGASEAQLNSGAAAKSSSSASSGYLPPPAPGPIHVEAKSAFGGGANNGGGPNNVLLKTYLPPSNEKQKYGYILEFKN